LPTDARALREGFRRLSPQSRRHRFLTGMDELDDAMIARLVDGVDGVHHIALVLIVLPPDGPEGPAGVARLVQDPADPATADIAVTVADSWQGRGAGTALVAALLRRRPAALRRLRTVVDAGNRASLALLAGAGHISSGPPHLGVLDVTVELTTGLMQRRRHGTRPRGSLPKPPQTRPPVRQPEARGRAQRILKHATTASRILASSTARWPYPPDAT
jgi:acetyltransferase